MSIGKVLGYEIIERQIMPDELLEADSIFLCGTATEIAGVDSVNGWQVKNMDRKHGSKIQDMYKVKVLFGEGVIEIHKV